MPTDLKKPHALNYQEAGKWVLRGVAQVMFQPHAGTGILFVVGLALGSPLVAVGALLGSALGTGLAWLLNYDREEIKNGIYGFNSSLVGIGLLTLLQPAPMTWVLVVLGSLLASPATYYMRQYLPFPTYTTPFILVTWLALVVGHGTIGHKLDAKPPALPEHELNFFDSILAGEAEVMLGASSLTGILFVVGIALSDWRHALIAVLGSAIGTWQARTHLDLEGNIALGIYGYNATLAAMAIWLSKSSLSGVLLSAIISVPLVEYFPKASGLPALTAPFVVATWMVLAFDGLDPLIGRNQFAQPSGQVEVPIPEPEETPTT